MAGCTEDSWIHISASVMNLLWCVILVDAYEENLFCSYVVSTFQVSGTPWITLQNHCFKSPYILPKVVFHTNTIVISRFPQSVNGCLWLIKLSPNSAQKPFPFSQSRVCPNSIIALLYILVLYPPPGTHACLLRSACSCL